MYTVLKTDLTGLRVLITRPRLQGQAWQASLMDAGVRTLTIPFLHIEPLTGHADLEAIKRVVLNMDQYQIAIFVSQNAVKYGFDWLDRYWPQPPEGVDYFAIGQTTAKLLAGHGFSVEAPKQAMNSESLLALPSLQEPAQESLGITLAERLLAVGAGEILARVYSAKD